jgi:hypothetical protein
MNRLASYELLTVIRWPGCTCGQCERKPRPYLIARFAVGGAYMVTWFLGLQ